MNFIGNYLYSLDDKGRLVIPSKFRNSLSDDVFLSLGFESTIELRTSEQYNHWISFLEKNSSLDLNARNLKRAILGNSYKVTIDSAGRINLPIPLTKISSIKKEVAIVGTNDKIEIWDRKRWEDFSQNITKGLLEDAAQGLNNKGT